MQKNIIIKHFKGEKKMGKIAKNTESRYFSELDSLGNKLIDIEGMTKRKDVWTSPESLKRIGEKDNIL